MNEQKTNFIRGDAWMVQFPNTADSEVPSRRPVVILQNNTGNYHSGTIIVAVLTSHIKKEYQPTHVVIESGTCMGLMVQAEQIYTLEKWRFYQYIGNLDHDVMEQIDKAVCVSLGITPPDRMRMCLCGCCFRNFQNAHGKRPRRVDRYQTEMDTCDYCNSRPGYDYWV